MKVAVSYSVNGRWKQGEIEAQPVILPGYEEFEFVLNRSIDSGGVQSKRGPFYVTHCGTGFTICRNGSRTKRRAVEMALSTIAAHGGREGLLKAMNSARSKLLAVKVSM